MAESSRPSAGGGNVVDAYYERLATVWGPDGVVGLPSDPAPVYADGTGGRVVYVRPGKIAALRGYDWDSGASSDPPIPVTVNTNTSGAARIDRIVLRLTRSTRLVRVGYIQGTPGAGLAPDLTQTIGASGVYEIPWAKVAVANGFTSLSADKVTPEHWCITDDGSILCTAATMPPFVMPGALVHQTDTGKFYVGTIGPPNATRSWKLVVDAADATFTAASGFSLTGGLWRRNGWITTRLWGRRTAAIIGDGATVDVGTIPDGWRPPDNVLVPLTAPNSGNQRAHFGIFRSSGQVQVIASSVGGITAAVDWAFAPAMWPAS